MEGVAHTFGTNTHKEIHFSLDHIEKSAKRARNEIMGVLVHEVVHCYQYNACATCPGGLIEGIAGESRRLWLATSIDDISTDFVRLHEGLAPPHWKATPGDTWDAGYERTAFFLDWIEKRYGTGTIRELNACMKDMVYRETLFKDLTGRTVQKLWKIYCGATDNANEEA